MRSLKSGFVGLIKKQKLEKNTMVPCGSLTKLLYGSSVGISTAGFILETGLSNRNTPRRFYHLFDCVGTYIPNYRHGTRWCNKCATIADTFSSDEQDYIPPAKVRTNTMFLLFIFYFNSKNT